MNKCTAWCFFFYFPLFSLLYEWKSIIYSVQSNVHFLPSFQQSIHSSIHPCEWKLSMSAQWLQDASKHRWEGNNFLQCSAQHLSKVNFNLTPEQTQLALAQHTNSLTARWWSSQAEQTGRDSWFPGSNDLSSRGLLFPRNTWTDED